jgi:hypothetical protein
MAMTEVGCGCKYKMFNDNPMALSFKAGCKEGRMTLSPEAVARHLGLIDTKAHSTPSGRSPRSWSPK